jgi:hypothetical protein
VQQILAIPQKALRIHKITQRTKYHLYIAMNQISTHFYYKCET